MKSSTGINYAGLVDSFRTRFQRNPRIFRSPGRINLIGEHTDYNDGFVMPAGIDREIAVLMAPSGTDKSVLVSVDTGETVEFTDENYAGISTGWARYIIGVYDQLRKAGHVPGHICCVFSGNIPMGAGLSSSAALECASLYAYCQLFAIALEKSDIARLAQKAENEFVGVQCGIMDQYASVFAKEAQVFQLDCRHLTHAFFPLKLANHELLLVDSTVKHSLASSEYNVRRRQCEQGVEVLRASGLACHSLRDVTRAELDAHRGVLGELVYRRCRYVIEENDRVVRAGKALANGELKALGGLLYQSHDGLSRDYEVSCEELDFLVDFTRNRQDVLGSRMMGGGFGGCTLNLVEKEMAEQFMADVARAFEERYHRQAPMYEVTIVSGTSEIQYD